MKKAIFAVFAVVAMAFGFSAMAADTIVKGVNQNGFQARVGTAPIHAIKHVAGVTSFKRALNGSSVYTLNDPTGAAYAAILATFGKSATEATSGFTYALTKVEVNCQSGVTSAIVVPGAASEFLPDGCNFATLAGQQ